MTLAIEKELTQDPRMLYRISTEGYHRMIELEEIEEGAPFELLDGYIVRKIRSAQGEDPRKINPNHATAVSRLVAHPTNGKGRYAAPLIVSARQNVTIKLSRTKSLKVPARRLLP
jgi:hypothetical protein